MRDLAGAVHMTKHKVAAEFLTGGERLLKVYAGASFQRSERSFAERFTREIGGKVFLVAMHDSQTASVDGDAGGHREFWCKRRSVYREFAAAGI